MEKSDALPCPTGGSDKMPPRVTLALLSATLCCALLMGEVGWVYPSLENLPDDVRRDVTKGIVLKGGIAVILAIVTVGLFRRSRRAWMWGRVGGIALTMWLAFTVSYAVRFWQGQQFSPEYFWPVMIPLGEAVSALVLPLGLGTASARKYFAVLCPKCQKVSKVGRDGPSYQRMRCADCGTKWQ